MSLTNAMRELTMLAINEAQLPAEFFTQVEQYYLPLAEFINTRAEQQSNALLLSLQGPQGAGKSTLCSFLKLLLEQQMGHAVAVLSLDDFYYPTNKRQQLAEEIHPLLNTRGVPGTHDLELAVTTISQLKNRQSVILPRFNKAEDNPFPREDWPLAPHNVSIILFEGWCNQVPAQSETELSKPINELERNEDPDGSWRHYVNHQLQHYHKQLFCLSDVLLHMSIPDFKLVYEWRGLQEQKLESATSEGAAIMNADKLRRFIQHFERLTRHAMKHLPGLAEACIHLNKDHQICQLELPGS
jgi:D-glycerate 3-kinase